MPTYLFTAMVVLGLLSIVFLFAIICKGGELRQAINVIDAAADYIRETKRVLGVPVFHFFLQMILVIVWFGGYLCIASLNKIEVDPVFP